MANTVIINKIQEKIAEIEVSDSSIIVLKGIPMKIVCPEENTIDLAKVVENKLQYFFSIFGKRKYLSYEEFLLLSDFVISQYKEVYILNNNLYMEQYPVEECFPNAIREGLLNHYTESEADDDDSIIGDIDDYISIFKGLKEYNGYLMGAYSEISSVNSNKIITLYVCYVKWMLLYIYNIAKKYIFKNININI